MEQKYLELIGNMIHYNELEQRDVFEFIISSIEYQEEKKESKYITEKVRSILDNSHLNFKDIVEYGINQDCVRYLTSEEASKFCEKFNIEYSNSNEYLDIDCGMICTDFTEDIVQDRPIIYFDNIENKFLYSIEKYNFKCEYDETVYYRTIREFNKQNNMEKLALYYLPKAGHYIINLTSKDSGGIKSAVWLGDIYIDKKLSKFETTLLLLKYKNRIRLKI